MKKALITGITGQDGAYLAEFLLKKGYEVHGIKRRSSLFNTERIDHLYKDPHEKDVKFKLHFGDLSDGMNLTRIIQEVLPDEIYNLGAMSHVKVMGLQDTIYLGNLNAKRDWGHAKDYVEAMWLMLQQDQPEDFVIATGITTSVRDLVKLAFNEVGIELSFEGENELETGKIAKCNIPTYQLPIGKVVVKIDPTYFRPTEVDLLKGDATKCREKLNWQPKYTLQDLVKEMMEHDLHLFKKDQFLKDGGFDTLNTFE